MVRSVLVVEDDAALAALVAGFLASSGWGVAVEGNGARAVARILAERPDAVVLDWMLPGLDGPGVLHAVRDAYDGPIILVTARGDERDEVEGLADGADDYMAKPLRPRALLARLERLCRGRGSPPPDPHARIEVDRQRRDVRVDGQPVILTTAEFDLGRVEALVEGQRALLQTVSHELRTPHARLRFRLERLSVAEGPEARGALLASIEKNLDEVEALLSELLAYVRVDGLPEATFGPASRRDNDPDADVASWLVDVMDQAQVGDSDADVMLDVPTGVPLPAVPRAWFARAVGNLVRNARRHARSRVEVRARGVAGTHVGVTIDDDGPGIASEDRDRLLQPFEVGDVQPGTASVGLGLAIASRVLERAGGELRVGTAPIGGARVTTTWPVRT